ncbi:hypothetical protein MNBD_NITROSPINAE03-1354 [hydrothermal vent metagenome]|uniref:Uncharacterized protein n=1 Tax=hydrothermal vent metagenome TaxID=652676 RepID=A0A3B1BUP6_9ZZZZ
MFLLVADKRIDADRLKKRSCEDAPFGPAELLALGSSEAVIETIVKEAAEAGMPLKTLDGVELIGRQVDLLRDGLHDWSAAVGKAEVGGVSVRRWFAGIGDRGLSGWWLTLLAEKNNLKSSLFLELAQLQAVAALLQTGNYSRIFISLNDAKLADALVTMAAHRDIPAMQPDGPGPGPERLSSLGEIRRAFKEGLAQFRLMYGRGRIARRIAGPPPSAEPLHGGVTFVTYFSDCNRETAASGSYRDRYFWPLQAKLEHEGRAIRRVAIFVPFGGTDFTQAAQDTHAMAEGGMELTLLDRYFSLGVALRILARWAWRLVSLARFMAKAPHDFLCAGMFDQAAQRMLKTEWYDSMAGRTGMQGIIYHELFRAHFASADTRGHCVYVCEFHPWERALVAARNELRPAMKTVGFQHTVVSPNYFVYGYRPDDLDPAHGPPLPLPDVIAANGAWPVRRLKSFGPAPVEEVEALRHLSPVASRPIGTGAPVERIVVVTGGYSRMENEKLLSVFHAAFPVADGFRALLKGHPASPFSFGSILKKLGVDPTNAQYELPEAPTADLLDKAAVIVAADSSMAVDALAAGTAVVIPRFADYIVTSPLIGHEGLCVETSGPARLREAVMKILDTGSTVSAKESERFVADIWSRDPKLSRWEKLLVVEPE